MQNQQKIRWIVLLAFITSFLSACSSTEQSNIKEVQLGTVVSVTLVPVKTESTHPQGGFGVTVGSGGHTGIYGSIDLATIGEILSPPAKPAMMQEIIVRRTNGKLVAITQREQASFHRGDKIKIVRRGDLAHIIH